MEQKQLHLLGVSFRTAPAAVREALSFNEQQCVELLEESARSRPELEAAVLSTCNRTEFYLALPPGSNDTQEWLLRLRQLRPKAQILREDCLRYQESGSAAAKHLMRVACGLDSAILGDGQILGQVKQAMALAARSGTLGATLAQVFQGAVRAGKQARDKTAIGAGSASIGAAGASMIAAERLGENGSARLLILGAGAVARDCARHVTKLRLGQQCIVNRSAASAQALAQDCGGEAAPWERLPELLAHADCVIAATAAPTAILTRPLLDRVNRARGGRELLVIDAGMPRNVEPTGTVRLLDIDAIRDQQAESLSLRRTAVPAVEAIVEAEWQRWERWVAARPMESVIKAVYQDADRLSRAAAQQLVAQGYVSSRGAEAFLHRTCKKLLHRHVHRLRRLTGALAPLA